jgi:broad specificity phosphatase PhoE
MNENAKTRIGLMRHAKTQWNLDKRIQGRNDSVLCREGIEQAERWGGILKDFGRWDKIATSGLSRAMQTGSIVNKVLKLPVERDPRLNEQDWGEWNGLTQDDLLVDRAEELNRRLSMGWEFRPPGGEDRLSVWERSSRALGELAARSPGENILAVAHGGVVKCLLYGLTGREFSPGETPVIKQYHLHMLGWDGGKLVLESMNAVRLG